MKDQVKRFAFIIIGQFIGAVAFTQVLLPNNLVAVGLGGVATIINHLTGMNLQLLLCLPFILVSQTSYCHSL